MRKCILLLLLASDFVHAADLTQLPDVPDLGEVYQFSVIETEVGLVNNSSHVITVQGIDDPTGSISLGHTVILQPGQTQAVPLTVHVNNRIGAIRFDAKLLTSPPSEGIVAVNAFVMSVLDTVRPIIDFGVMDAGSKNPQTFSLVSHEIDGLKVTAINYVAPGFDADVLPGGTGLVVSARPDLGWGTHLDYVKVGIDSSAQHEIWIRVKADVRGEIQPSENPVDFSVVRRGEVAEKTVRLQSRSKQKLEVDSIEMDGVRVSHEVKTCPGQRSDGCLDLVLRLDNQQPLGQIFGSITVAFKQERNRLPIGVRGLVISSDQKIIDLNKTSALNTSSVPVRKIQDQLKALTGTAAPGAAVEPPGRGPLLKWAVGNENGLYGYAVYRSTSETDGFSRINHALVRASNGGDNVSSNYQWRDNSAEPGKAYWYYIGAVYNDGHKQQLTGPQKVVAK